MKYLETIKIKSFSEKGEIEGYASVFDEIDSYGDIVVKNAFSQAISDTKKGNMPKLLWQHDISSPIGVINEISEDEHGLFVKAQLLLDLPKAKEIYTLLKNKAIDGFSIGYRIRNQYIKNDHNYLTDLELLEISIVTFPACKSATIENIKIDKKIQEENKMRNDMLNIPLSEEKDTGLASFIRKGVDTFFTKSLNESNDKDGAIFLPQNIIKRIDDKLKFLSPMRNIAKIITISTNAVDILVDSKLPDAGWTSENEERIETDSPEVKKIKIPVYELYAKPKANQHLLDDSEIDVEEWLIDKIAEKFASLEDSAFINGDGTSKPHGFLKYSSNSDENRTFGILQHFLTGAKGKFVDNDSALNILIDMVCSIKPIYVKNAKWIMSRSALSEIRKIKNGDSLPIWAPSIADATPSTLLGYPVIIDDNMPALVNGQESTSVAFGDFSSGYQIVERQGLSILRDPYTSKPFVEFYASKRVGGDVIDFDAIKLLKFDEIN